MKVDLILQFVDRTNFELSHYLLPRKQNRMQLWMWQKRSIKLKYLKKYQMGKNLKVEKFLLKKENYKYNKKLVHY